MQLAGYLLVRDREERFDEYYVVFDDGRGSGSYQISTAAVTVQSLVSELLLDVLCDVLILIFRAPSTPITKES